MSGSLSKVPAVLVVSSAVLGMVGVIIGWFGVSSVLQVADSASGNHLHHDLNSKKLAALAVGTLCIFVTLLAVKWHKRWLAVIVLLLEAYLADVILTQTSTMKVSALFGLTHSVGYWLSLATTIFAGLASLWLILTLGKTGDVSMGLADAAALPANPVPAPVVMPSPTMPGMPAPLAPVQPVTNQPVIPQPSSLPVTPPAPVQQAPVTPATPNPVPEGLVTSPAPQVIQPTRPVQQFPTPPALATPAVEPSQSLTEPPVVTQSEPAAPVVIQPATIHPDSPANPTPAPQIIKHPQ